LVVVAGDFFQFGTVLDGEGVELIVVQKQE